MLPQESSLEIIVSCKMSLSLLLVFEETCRLYCKVVAFILILFFSQGGDIEYKGDPLQDFTLMR